LEAEYRESKHKRLERREAWVIIPLACLSEPFAVILSPSLVILSGAKNLALPLSVNSAKSLS